MTATTDTSGLLDTPEAARTLGVSPRTLIRWRNERTGPPWIRLGKQIRYRRQSLDDWLTRKEVVPAREAAG